MSKQTALYARHLNLQAKMTDFGGWDMPLQYTGILKEYEACRSEVALFDTGHMGEFFFSGDAESSGFAGATTIDAQKLPVGKCKYGFLLSDTGGIIDDIIIYRLALSRWMVVVNAGATPNDFAVLGQRIRGGSFENRSESMSKLDIQGPKARVVLVDLLPEVATLKFFQCVETTLFGQPIILSRTGYTGELGFEVYGSGEVVGQLWDACIAKGAAPAGLGARDVLRLELGYSLYGNDLDESTSPLEANLAGFLDWEREFVGKAALEAQKSALPRILLPFITTSRRAPRHGYAILHEGVKIGEVTSGVFSPAIEKGIGLGYMNRSLPVGVKITLDDGRGSIEAEISSLPFYQSGSLKS